MALLNILIRIPIFEEVSFQENVEMTINSYIQSTARNSKQNAIFLLTKSDTFGFVANGTSDMQVGL